MKDKITILRKIGNGQYLKYTDPIIIEKTKDHIIFKDSKTGNEIILPTGDYQYEIKRGDPSE